MIVEAPFSDKQVQCINTFLADCITKEEYCGAEGIKKANDWLIINLKK